MVLYPYLFHTWVRLAVFKGNDQIIFCLAMTLLYHLYSYCESVILNYNIIFFQLRYLMVHQLVCLNDVNEMFFAVAEQA